ncbi:CHAT domain-containing protein [Streptomyces sp. NPDC006624]|uniref:CHAT domain-containing protein n=1 Tax=unclassified Streptomyces TaxID=2593676 RepID=UPI0033A3DC88
MTHAVAPGAERIRRLLERQRYAGVLEAVDPDTADEETWTLLLRCRLEQGLVRDALVLAEAGRRRFPGDGVAGLWCRFAALHATDAVLTPAVLDAFLRHGEHRAAEADEHSPAAATAAHLRAQALGLECVLRGRLPESGGLVGEAWEVAAVGYRRAGLPAEADRVLRRAASFLTRGPGSDVPRARRLLVAAAGEAERRGDALSRAETAFASAELELEVWFAREFGEQDADVVPLAEALERAADGLAEAGGCLAEGRALWVMGRLCLEYGVPDGVPLAGEAAIHFRQGLAVGQELAVWQALEVWHLRQGDASARERARVEASALTERVGHPLADEALAISDVDSAFRGAEQGRAEALTAGADLVTDRMFPGQAVVRASVLATMELTEEAVALLREVARELRAHPSPSTLLPQVSLSLANLLARTDSIAADAELVRGADAARVVGEPADEARCLALRAWVSVLARKQGGCGALSSVESDGQFDRAVELLLPLRTLEARDHLISVFQQRGQAAFFDSDWERCGHWLTRSEELARGLGLGFQLAYTLSYQALVLMEIARTGGLHLYEEADRRLREAQTGYVAAGIRGEIWRLLFHRGLCALESGDRHAPSPEERDRLRGRAATFLLEAAQEIDRLRAASATAQTPALRTQVARIASGGGKSEVYRIGFELHWHRRADPCEALRWLERAKARTLLDGLTALTRTAGQRSPELARERDLQQRPAATDAGELALREEIDQLLASLRGGPLDAYAQVKLAEPPRYGTLRAALQAERRHTQGRRLVVAEYRCTPSETLVFGLREDWDEPEVAAVPLDHGALSRFAGQYVHRPGGVRALMEERTGAGTRAWDGFASLVAPLSRWTEPGDVVCLVPHGVLHDLPLHTLPVAGEPLLLRNPVTYSPSSAALLELLNRGTRGTATRTGTAAVFGDSLGDLPMASGEARAVARLLSVEAATGAEVTGDRVLGALGSRSLVHVAGHGRLSTGDGFEHGMELADGTLRASDLIGRRVAAGLVVLSGCETGVNEYRAGDEPVGLTRALLLGGSRTVIAGQWRVVDGSAAALFSVFHRQLAAGHGSADALHRAARAVAGRPAERRHFYHWGAFVAVGDWL